MVRRVPQPSTVARLVKALGMTTGDAPLSRAWLRGSGVDATNPDLQGRISASSATCLGASCTIGIPTDNEGHGTHVSGIAGAATDNGTGIAGLAYGSPLIVVRVFDNSGSGAATSDVANGIAWAASHGATSINLSLGGYSPAGMPITLCNAVELAINSYHSVVVAAAGNDAVASPSYPAACPGAIGVAATDQSDAPAYFSNYGSPNVFVSAPGVNILSTYPGAVDCSPDPVGYCTESGTSMASPLVTALAALIRTEHPEATVGQVRQMLAENSDKVGPGPYVTAPVGSCPGCTWEQHYGYGRINVQRALTAAVPALPPPPPPPPAATAAAAASSPRSGDRRDGSHGSRLRGSRSPGCHGPASLPSARQQGRDDREDLRLPAHTGSTATDARAAPDGEHRGLLDQLARPARARLVPLLRPRYGQRGKPQPARLRLSQRSLSSRLGKGGSDFGRELGDLGRRRADANASLLERFLLGLRRAR